MLINVILLTIVGILTFISMINTEAESKTLLYLLEFLFYEQLKFRAKLS